MYSCFISYVSVLLTAEADAVLCRQQWIPALVGQPYPCWRGVLPVVCRVVTLVDILRIETLHMRTLCGGCPLTSGRSQCVVLGRRRWGLLGRYGAHLTQQLWQSGLYSAGQVCYTCQQLSLSCKQRVLIRCCPSPPVLKLGCDSVTVCWQKPTACS